jgi:hypothetical protein
MKVLGNALFAIFATVAVLAPFLLFNLPNTSTDLQISILARTLSAHLFWEHGFYNRVPQILSGIDPWSSGLFSLKLDSLFMTLVTTPTSIIVLFFARCLFFIAILSIFFHHIYGAPFRIAIGCAACAFAGLNILNWLYYPPDYIGGGTVGLAYALFPILLVPIILDQKIKSSIVLAFISFLIGSLYGAASFFFIAIFGCYVAGLWTVIQINSLRGWIIAVASCTGVAVAIAPELFRFLQIGAGGGLRNTFILYFEWYQTLNILVNRDANVTLVGCALAVIAILMAFRRPVDLAAMRKLIVIYILSMFLDPIVKTFGRPLENILPTFVLSTSYYAYIFSPVVFGAFLCSGFKYIRGVLGEIVPLMLVLIAAKLTVSGVEINLTPRVAPDLSIHHELSNELKNRAAKQQRAVVVRETEDDLERSRWRLARLSPNEFSTFGLYMADGYIANPDNNYAIFMSNVAMPAGTGVTTKSRAQRNIVLNVPVSSHLVETAEGCIEQRSPIAVDDYLSLPVLQNAAVQYIISMYRLESRYLSLSIAGRPVFCSKGRGDGRPFVYEFVQKIARFGLARDISIVEDLGEAYRLLREDTEFASKNRVVLTSGEAVKLRGPVSGIGSEESNVKLIADDGDRLKLTVSSPNDTLLLIRDSYSQPVIASAEDGQLDVVRINGSFIGVRVRRGSHDLLVVFK